MDQNHPDNNALKSSQNIFPTQISDEKKRKLFYDEDLLNFYSPCISPQKKVGLKEARRLF